jgi:hypothetical protein
MFTSYPSVKEPPLEIEKESPEKESPATRPRVVYNHFVEVPAGRSSGLHPPPLHHYLLLGAELGRERLGDWETIP